MQAPADRPGRREAAAVRRGHRVVEVARRVGLRAPAGLPGDRWVVERVTRAPAERRAHREAAEAAEAAVDRLVGFAGASAQGGSSAAGAGGGAGGAGKGGTGGAAGGRVSTFNLILNDNA